QGAKEGRVKITDEITAVVLRVNGKTARVTFEFGRGGEDIKHHLRQVGVMPLPPYIKKPADQVDTQRYQTVYAQKEGAIAAPTAGLHFTDELLDRIKEKGVIIKKLTLHVGCGTFKPVICEDIEQHEMENEYYEISDDTTNELNRAKSEGRRIIAVGTTVTRALEGSAASMSRKGARPACRTGRGKSKRLVSEGQEDNTIKSGSGKTSIFIFPGYKFKVIDALITNFHLPKSTPLMLTSAFSGLELLRKAYAGALNADYRFFSYGDAMFIM
ncbi:MAG: tRNA preQ1(34) S-adenosylmethionine ribosyltransferase-isomerase QueA, partial [Nitrospirae bacterium]|nr:tRNA preQ1(34) S-adenosylmethionine ribosyltransferase-isomerase QueA [Nitrospirota bacterium]